jgi:hypothetical protein
MDHEESNTVIEQFDALLKTLRETKPNDRSEQDRYHAITITEVEKARAVFMVYAQPKG